MSSANRDGGSRMSRRDLLAAGMAGAGALGAGPARARGASGWSAGAGKGAGFLSSVNPLATQGQRLIEDRALALLKTPELVRARQIVTGIWQGVSGWLMRDQADRFNNMIDEYMFHHAMRAANSDANYPEVAWFMKPPRPWFGRAVPGSRWAGDSPDFLYRTIPIAHGGRYAIHGYRVGARSPIVFYSLMGDNHASPAMLSLIESMDMQIDSDGSFTLTVDSTPAGGRPNHLQTRPGAEFMMIRDALGDWSAQSANALVVERLDRDGGPKSLEAMAAFAADIAVKGVYYAFYVTQVGRAPNVLAQPGSSAALGGVPTQRITGGRLSVEADDDALVIRSNAAGANFRNIVLTDLFQMSNEYWQRTSSFNMAQMAPDDDGDFTFVVAHRDPGIHNWLDTGGLRHMLLTHRWQAFDRSGAKADPWISIKAVKRDDLDKLPAGVRRIDAAGRAAQIAGRKAGCDRRFIDA